MQVVSVFEQEDNQYLVNAVFTSQETATIVEAGLRLLLANGALPLRKLDEKRFQIVPPSQVQMEIPLENPSS